LLDLIFYPEDEGSSSGKSVNFRNIPRHHVPADSIVISVMIAQRFTQKY
jgi:hypothetical protein